MSLVQNTTPAKDANPFHAPVAAKKAPTALHAVAGPLAQAAEKAGTGGGAAPLLQKAAATADAHSAHNAGRSATSAPGAPPADGSYHSPYSGAFMAGIGTNTEGALTRDRNVNGRGPGYGYAAYGPSPTDAHAEITETVGPSFLHKTFHQNVTIPYSAMDTVGDIAAVTQYAAAADQAVKLNRGADGKPSVTIDWKKLGETPVEANYDFTTHGHNLPGAQQIKYDNPAKVAEGGQKAVFDDMKASGKDPKDKDQFVSITGHSGGGQSSFYTALKMASEGYKNVSVVGVDMAMTPHERQALEALGVKVTNITSNNTDAKGTKTSEIGEFIKTGMGGGDNYYDLNVQRQKTTDAPGRHGIDTDSNVTTMVRFAQYLDASGQHGKFSPELYKKFLAENPGGNVLNPGGPGAKPETADANLLTKVQDNRGKAGPQPRTEKDFQKWFASYLQNTGEQFLPLPDTNIGAGPLSINPAHWGAGELGKLAASNDGKLVQMLQSMGVDTTNIAGLEKYNSGSVSNHWGKLNPIDIPLPDWVDIKQ